MQVRIRYQLHSEAVPRVLELTPEEYFDPVDPGETLEIRSVPKHSNAFRYLPFASNDLAWTVVDISDGSKTFRIRTQLLEGSDTLMHHTQDSDGYEEIIHSTSIASDCSHTIRTVRQPGKSWTTVMSALIVERPTQLTTDRDFCDRMTKHQLLAFEDVR